jgi:hypothetical protein
MRSPRALPRSVARAVAFGLVCLAMHRAWAAPEPPPPAVAPASNPPGAIYPGSVPADDYYGAPSGYSAVGGYGYPPIAEGSEGFHVHDGFFLRAQLGGGVSSLQSTTNGVKTVVGGGGGAFGLAIGGVIAHNLILYGAFFESAAANPDVQVGGTSVASPIGDTDWQGIGPGLAYYYGPLNLYFGGAIVMTRFWMHDQNGNQLDSSKAGLGLDLEVGKEWWVSRDWGLGIALRLAGSSMKDQNDPTLTWSAGAGSVLFSATYN